MVELYADQFSDAYDYGTCDGPTRCIVIASTPRSGSHMLGHSMRETGAFGFPLEYLQPANLAEWRKRLGGANARAILAEIMRLRTAPNGVFGMKAHYRHLDRIGGFSGLLDVLENPVFIHIMRRDLLGQAISYVRASQTGIWIEGQKGNGAAPVYDGDAIAERLAEIAQHDAGWRHLLAQSDAPSMSIIFEDARADIAGTIVKIAEFAAIPIEPRRLPTTPPTRPQERAGSDDWAERFRAEGRMATLPQFGGRTAKRGGFSGPLRRMGLRR